MSNASATGLPQPAPFAHTRTGAFVEFWQTDAAGSYDEARPIVAVYVDTRRWRNAADGLSPNRAQRYDRLHVMLQSAYDTLVQGVRHEINAATDLTHAGAVAAEFTQALFSCCDVEEFPVRHTLLAFADWQDTLAALTAGADGAVRLRVFTRDGEYPAHWFTLVFDADLETPTEPYLISPRRQSLRPSETPDPEPKPEPVSASLEVREATRDGLRRTYEQQMADHPHDGAAEYAEYSDPASWPLIDL